jgi:hypothetical protein
MGHGLEQLSDKEFNSPTEVSQAIAGVKQHG